MIEKVIPANLQWDEDQVPRSDKFGDLYFSAENGLDESRHVFLNGNNLTDRWANLTKGDVFVIAETGFGSGLNLLAAAELWEQIAHPEARLHYLSIERFPILSSDLLRCHRRWPSLTPLSDRLASLYPHLTAGYHRFNLTEKITTTLIFDDITAGLSSLCPPLEPTLWHHRPFSVDAWFLDGFAPAKNPDMWQPDIYPLINRLSKTGSTLATFTAAGDVRRALKHWGFDVAKVPGYGRKREMLTATFSLDNQIEATLPKPEHKKPVACWTLSEPTTSVYDSASPSDSSIGIIGAGIAGATLANALARRGKKVCVYDKAPCPASGASGNPLVALYAKLSPDAGDLEDFMLSNMTFSQAYYSNLIATHPERHLGEQCGLIQLPRDGSEREKMMRISERLAHAKEFVSFETSDALSKISNISVQTEGLYFPNSGWMNGPETCTALLDQNHIQVRNNAEVEHLQTVDGKWQLDFADGKSARHAQLIICNAKDSDTFTQLQWLPTRSIRGQISMIPSPSGIVNLKTVICRETQVTPAVGGLHCIGATYGLDDASTDLRQQDHAQNIKKLCAMLAGNFATNLLAPNADESYAGRASVRCTTPDYLPIVGAVPRYDEFISQFAKLSKDSKSHIPFPAPVEPNLFVNVGYGSRGYSYAPLCAETLASQICGEPPALPDYLVRATHPARFLVRDLIRGKINI